MNFFDSLSTEARGLLSMLNSPKPTTTRWKFKLEITHRDYHGTDICEVELPYEYTSKHNAEVMFDQLNSLAPDDIRWIAKEHNPHASLGIIEKVFVRRKGVMHGLSN